MHVLFVAPHFPSAQVRYARALKQVGAKVTGIGEPPAHELPDEVAHLLDGWEQIHNVTDVDALKFSEIGARPPGVSHWDIYCAANEIDLYKEWADGIIKIRGAVPPAVLRPPSSPTRAPSSSDSPFSA